MACNKIRFENQHAANLEIDRIAEYNLLTCRPRYSYFCNYCKYWHLTSEKPKTYLEAKAAKADPEHKRTVYIKRETEYWLDKLGGEPKGPKFKKIKLGRF